MVCSTFLEEILSRVRDLRDRSRLVGKGLSDQQLNWSPGEGLWSIGQIYEHLHIANNLYFPELEKSIDFGKYGNHAEVRHSLIGSAIIKAAGPRGNAPVPKRMDPGPGPFKVRVLEEFDEDHQRIEGFASQSRDLNLSASKMNNPMLPLIKMNLADAFEIMVAHGERHVGQIELVQRRPDYPR